MAHWATGAGGYIPPPPGAVSGGQPDPAIHAAFPGAGGGGGAGTAWGTGGWPPATGGGSGHGTPWPTQAPPLYGPSASGSSWANTPAPAPASYPAWATPYSGQPPPSSAPAWANTPAQAPVRQGWGPAAGPAPAAGGNTWENDPWAVPTAPPPMTAPAASHGFSATAAPPPGPPGPVYPGMGMGGAPVTPGWGGQPLYQQQHPAYANPPRDPYAHYAAAQSHHPREQYEEEERDPEDEYYDYDAEERERQEARAAAAAHAAGWARGGHTPGPPPGHDPWAAALGAAGPSTPAGGAAWATPGWGGEEMRRTHSAGHSTGPGHRPRAHSFGGTSHSPHPHPAAWAAYAHSAAAAAAGQFSEEHLAKRPSTWRADFPGIGDASMNATATPSSFSLFRRKSLSSAGADEWHDPRKRVPCDLLKYSTTTRQGKLAYDMRVSPEQTPPGAMGFFPAHPGDMIQPAVLPPAPKMRLVLARSPWYVDVRPSNGQWVALFDVLAALHGQLASPIANTDYFNKALTRSERLRITEAFRERCERAGAVARATVGAADPEHDFAGAEIARGVKRVDYLLGECFFVGLVRRGGVWEAKCLREIAR
ncbi:hypothetical protein MIND_00912800 [Mycena indigotica]|uniref:DUF6699 domain-containing protein n=1 Tax=Mycena indigotica TaxID=2126181 RepID=A0A8H6SCB3_9AGAR|nr:uncharacterized protein MIND_00912800 [Mycena indigotica]KAF7296818.1 hypothetical protein MIND_00912800 [Mycena indigotica]